MGRPLKIKHSSTIDIGFNNPQGGSYYGVVGGNTSLSSTSYPVVRVRVKIGSNSEADGYIITQKGSTKYLVSDGVNTGVCILVDKADSTLGSNEMTVTATLPDSTTIRLQRFTNKWGLDFSDNRYLLNFFATSDNIVIKAGAYNNGTVDLVQVENPSV